MVEVVAPTSQTGPGIRILGFTIRVVKNIRDFFYWISTWAFLAITALPFVWSSMPPEVKAYIPEKYLPFVAMAVALGGLVGRIVDQKGKA